MLKRVAVVMVFVVAAGVAAAQGPELPTVDAAHITFDPAVFKLHPGERRMVQVRVSGVPEPGLAAFQVELAFDPAAVQVDDPNGAATSAGVPTFAPLGGSPLCAAVRGLPTCPDPQWMFTAGGRQPFGTSRIDNAGGNVVIGFGSTGFGGTVAGDGVLALLQVTGVAGGETGLRVQRAILADADDPPGRYEVVLQPYRPGGPR